VCCADSGSSGVVRSGLTPSQPRVCWGDSGSSGVVRSGLTPSQPRVCWGDSGSSGDVRSLLIPSQRCVFVERASSLLIRAWSCLRVACRDIVEVWCGESSLIAKGECESVVDIDCDI
jgi:hypothetical protein